MMKDHHPQHRRVDYIQYHVYNWKNMGLKLIPSHQIVTMLAQICSQTHDGSLAWISLVHYKKHNVHKNGGRLILGGWNSPTLENWSISSLVSFTELLTFISFHLCASIILTYSIIPLLLHY